MGLDGLIARAAPAISRHRQRHRRPTSGTRRPTRCIAAHLLRRATSSRRAANRAALEARFGLDADDGPLFCVVSRLTWQKGIDLLAEALRRHRRAAAAQLAVLGSGDPALEGGLRAAAARHPGRVGVRHRL